MMHGQGVLATLAVLVSAVSCAKGKSPGRRLLKAGYNADTIGLSAFYVNVTTTSEATSTPNAQYTSTYDQPSPGLPHAITSAPGAVSTTLCFAGSCANNATTIDRCACFATIPPVSYISWMAVSHNNNTLVTPLTNALGTSVTVIGTHDAAWNGVDITL